ncbi:hypothetical protein [Hyperthermus butylicus]|uniref:4Fe-4S ferredoxin-type domain-containing protein n=1 Tax=Hyperthermus butylicus (strain DSM 5456 / JCM 9403 / PLM1-5) TaxID=415426 RepID=A2BMJ1_HYPBU|nr:hypothetical protein [Hyperthermus butylicus]ABM81202.1 hypothetical protein Hbut_1377 [Hyperthermus butylicus DSM 5456]
MPMAGEDVAGGAGIRVEVVCMNGISSAKCTRTVEIGLGDLHATVDLLDDVWGESPERPVLLVSTSLRGFDALVKELGELGRNPFLVEATGIPETMLSGLSLDNLIDYYAGFIAATLQERQRAKRRTPPVTRREALRRFFLIPPEYVVLPRLRGSCGDAEVCPYSALTPEGLDEARCRGCMLCAAMCPGAVEQLAWTGAASLAYAYSFADRYALDGILFICRRSLGMLDEYAVDASPARLLPFHVPCISWLQPSLLAALNKLGIRVHVHRDPGICNGCQLEAAAGIAEKLLSQRGVRVSPRLSEASIYAYTGYTRPKKSMREILVMLAGMASDTAEKA